MSGRLAGKVALVTGAAGGIGSAMAHRFQAEGAHVLVTDADAKRVHALGDALGVPAREHDVTDEQSWESVAAWALDGRRSVDILVNNAGILLVASLQETTLEKFRRVQEVNQVGVFLGMRTFAPIMVTAGAGSIINLSSVAGRSGMKYGTAYAASKWAVRGMTKSVALEVAKHGVRVNSLHPGPVDTDMNNQQKELTPGLVDKVVAGIPMGRVADPAEVANAAVYFASDESRYLTGSEIVIDGGATA
ncbi:SDR family NAD(P)-dependent oxidoreductase [Streptomyces sp. NPDC101234]|uniref:SDR family NAD(P)-dependent oxidoreductase n=1 Tax=Streptomyces sp. NPDC101234 TaxID=3366138 RepID=UPI003830A704